MKIETERLILRPFEESDYDDLFEFLSQLEIQRRSCLCGCNSSGSA